MPVALSRARTLTHRKNFSLREKFLKKVTLRVLLVFALRAAVNCRFAYLFSRCTQPEGRKQAKQKFAGQIFVWLVCGLYLSRSDGLGWLR